MYKSTRGTKLYTASYAILNGIAKDGGLFTPSQLDSFSLCASDQNLSYQALAKKVFSFFLDDFTDQEIDKVLKDCYQEEDFKPDVVGLKKLGEFYLLSLYHGPTFAFKDMALSVISPLFNMAKEKQNNQKKNIILTATSGDTGSATLSGFNNDPQTSVIVLYPNLMISQFQESQMHYFSSKKNHVIAIDGNFDDCQNIVKKAFLEIKLERATFSSANSINIARIIPQVVYYFYSYLKLVKSKEIQFGELINFSVPTGNFGNILAGYLAKSLGLPVDKLIVASNQNDVLTDFFNTGIYDKNRKFHNTISPSMDILISSNLERLLYLLSDRDDIMINHLMNDLKTTGRYQVSDVIKSKMSDFKAYTVSEAQTKEVIKSINDQLDFLVDPHTAVGIKAYDMYKDQTKDQTKTIVLSTASPLKFSEAVLSAIDKPLSKDAAINIKTLMDLNTEIKDDRSLEYLNTQVNKVIWSKTEALDKLKDLVGDLDVDN